MNSNNTISLLISLLLLLTMSPPAIADGLVSNGHINGSHTDMTLTRDQIVALDHGQKKSHLLLNSESSWPTFGTHPGLSN